LRHEFDQRRERRDGQRVGVRAELLERALRVGVRRFWWWLRRKQGIRRHRILRKHRVVPGERVIWRQRVGWHWFAWEQRILQHRRR
jgi:hypothetical protein